MISSLDDVARQTGFSGAIRLDRGDHTVHLAAYGLANRAYSVQNTVHTQFGVASGTKSLTALTVMALVERGNLTLDTAARSLLGADLPLIDDAVTVRHLLAHRSGIGDYLDETGGFDTTSYPMPVPVHQLVHTTDYLPILDGHPSVFEPGSEFRYCNSGYVVLALLLERATGGAFHELVDECVVQPAGLTSTGFLRTDRLPGTAAVGYLDDEMPGWTNVLHLPVRGTGDGGIFTTVDDVCRLWRAVLDGRVVNQSSFDQMTAPVSAPATASGSYDYGLGCWLRNPGHTVEWEGCDAGVSFRAGHDRATDVTYAVCANTSEGAWPVADEMSRLIDEGGV
jgi:CubicO group peptidase (beta-lactamase class C family)